MTKIYLVTNCYGDPNKVYIGKTKPSWWFYLEIQNPLKSYFFFLYIYPQKIKCKQNNMDNFDLKKYLAENKLNEFQSQPKYNEFMLEWMVPGEESNTIISKNLKELFRMIEEKNIEKYIIKGWNGRNWDILIK